MASIGSKFPDLIVPILDPDDARWVGSGLHGASIWWGRLSGGG